jgi:hypothetical protein
MFMRFLKVLLIVTLSGCASSEKITYVGVASNLDKSQVASLYSTMPAIRIISIDGKKYNRNLFKKYSNEVVFLKPGMHTITIEYCNCSGSGSTFIAGTHTFEEEFIKGHEYGLVFNYAPPNRHELWLSHVYANKKGRTRKEIQATLGPFKLTRSEPIYVN